MPLNLLETLDHADVVRSDLSARIKEHAASLGFVACGLAPAAPSQTHNRLVSWLAQGFHASMNWMAREDAVAKRADVRNVFPNAKTVICVAMHYRTDAPWDEAAHGLVARYARGIDYHEFLTARLRELLGWIQEQTSCEGRVYCDSAPLLERELAQRAGLGWIGKNTMLLSRELGSYFLLGEILLDIDLPADRPHIEQFCGSCTRCLDACPTQAFPSAGVLDANKCISYHTIENKKIAPLEVRDKVSDWVFGCDICQQVCPWNNKSTAHSYEPELWTREEMPTLLEMLLMPQDEFSRRLKGSPLKRAKKRGMKRNALAVLRSRRRRA